jgi:predicted DNA-binding antitoxin AbrB/MazE fold protein
MVRINAHYQHGHLILEHPLDLPDGAEVIVEIVQLEFDEQNAWELACSRMETELEMTNSRFDDWRKLYGVSESDRPHD